MDCLHRPGAQTLVRLHRALPALISFGKNNGQLTSNVAWSHHIWLAHWSADLKHSLYISPFSYNNRHTMLDKSILQCLWSAYNFQLTLNVALSNWSVDVRHGVQLSSVTYIHKSPSIGHGQHISSMACTHRSSNVGHLLPTTSIAWKHRSSDVIVTWLHCIKPTQFGPSISDGPTRTVFCLHLLDEWRHKQRHWLTFSQ